MLFTVLTRIITVKYTLHKILFCDKDWIFFILLSLLFPSVTSFTLFQIWTIIQNLWASAIYYEPVLYLGQTLKITYLSTVFDFLLISIYLTLSYKTDAGRRRRYKTSRVCRFNCLLRACLSLDGSPCAMMVKGKTWCRYNSI